MGPVLVAFGAGKIESIGRGEEIDDRVNGEIGAGIEEGAEEMGVDGGVVGSDAGDGEACPGGEASEIRPCLIAGGVRFGATLEGEGNFPHPVFPFGAEGIEVMGSVGGDGEARVKGAWGEGVIVPFPVGDFEARDAELGEGGADIMGDVAEVFADEAAGACFVDEMGEDFDSLVAIGGLVGRGIVWERDEMGEMPSRDGGGFVGGEGDEIVIAIGEPREGVDAEEAEDMIDAKEVESGADLADALPPPGEIFLAMLIPFVEGDAPILAPLGGEGIIGEIVVGARAAAPLVIEELRVSPDIGAEVTDSEGDIAHQGDAFGGGVRFSGEPLLIGEPLEVLVEADLVEEGIAVGGGEMIEPEASEGRGLVMSGPPVPAFAVVIFGEERAEEGVVVEPSAFVLAESGEAGGAIGMRDAGGEIGKGEGEEGVFEIGGAGINDGAVGELLEVVLGFEGGDFCGGEIGDGEGGDFEG